VNIRKSEAVVFNRAFRQPDASVNLLYNGTTLEIKPAFVYLGICFDEKEGVGGPVLVQEP